MAIPMWRKGTFGAKTSWKIFAGFFVAAVALLTMGMSLLLRSSKACQARLPLIVLGLAGAGIVLILLGLLLKRRGTSANTVLQLGGEQQGEESSRPLLLAPEFWGAILLLSAGPIYLFTRIVNPREPAAPAVVVAPTPPPPAETNKPPPPPPPPEFPSLNLEGFVYNGARSTAVINGKTVQLGESVSGVTVVAIEPDGVTVEFQGERRVLKLKP
jgi:Type II secretion system protein B